MSVFVIAVAATVPILLLLSLVLVASRYVHDLIAARHRIAARALAAGILLLGTAGAAPMVLRASLLVRAELAASHGDWVAVDQVLRTARELGARLSWSMKDNWLRALIAQQRWREAEQLVMEDTTAGPDAPDTSSWRLLVLGLARYHMGRLGDAARVLLAIPDRDHDPIRAYLLGRIAYRTGHRAEAEDRYRASLALQGGFFPAVYNLVAALLEDGDATGAAAVLDEFERSAQPAAGDPQVEALRHAIEGRAAAPRPREFFIVFS